MNNVLKLKNKDKLGKFEIKNSGNNSADLYIYGDIVADKWFDTDVAPQDIKDFIEQLDDKQNINIYINSGGGSVFAGMAIYNMLKRNKAYKTVYIDGLAGSIASVIAMVGDKIVIPSNSYFMIHKAWSLAIGNSYDMLKMSETLDRIDEGILEVYKTKLKEGANIETVKDLIDAETWLTGNQVAEYFDIEVGEELQAVASCSNLQDYSNVPEDIKQIEVSEVDVSNESEINNLKARLNLELEI